VALEPVPSIPPLVVVAHDDPATADSLRHAVESAAGWQVLVADPSLAGLTAAIAAGPSVALVGCAVLGGLPADCQTPLIAVGDDDRPADVRAAVAAGARSLLAWPDGAADLPGELARAAATAPEPVGGHSALVIATRGVQGGAGTTTIATHLAAAWSRWGPSPVLLLDLSGGLAFRLDLGSVASWSSLFPRMEYPAPATGMGADPDALEPGVPLHGNGLAFQDGTLAPGGYLDPGAGTDTGSYLVGPGAGNGVGGYLSSGAGNDTGGYLGPGAGNHAGGYLGPGGTRSPIGDLGPGDTRHPNGDLDPAALARSLAEPWPGLSVLPLLGLVDGVADPPPDPRDVWMVLEAAAAAYRVIVVDLPVAGGLVAEAALSRADVLLAVGRCETAGVRGLQAAIGAWAATGHDPETAGAVVTGVRPRAPLAPREVRAALGDSLWGILPAAAAELAAAAEDGVLLLDRHDLPVVQAMVTLANRVVPFTAVPA
jgi:cellulose biosynthesis protein BcsQ